MTVFSTQGQESSTLITTLEGRYYHHVHNLKFCFNVSCIMAEPTLISGPTLLISTPLSSIVLLDLASILQSPEATISHNKES